MHGQADLDRGSRFAQAMGPAGLLLGARYRILAFDLDEAELGELLARLSHFERVDVAEEHSLHDALPRLVLRPVHLLLLDARRTPSAVTSRLADAARSARRGPSTRIVLATAPLPVMGPELDVWIAAYLAAAT